jgi:rod shape-determining protein MreC
MHREARIANYVLAAFSVVSLVLLSLPLTAPVQAFKACVVYLLDPAAYNGARGVERLAAAPAAARSLLAADSENRLMLEQVRQALWVKAEADALRADNRRLRAALGLKPPAQREAVWASVMERDPLHWYRSVVVGAGREQGIALNAPVLGAKGGALAAVGRIVEVRARSSVVLLATDELSSVAAYLSSSTAEGLVQGQGSSRLRMEYLSPEASLSAGYLVYTSPTSAIFPPDILIGRVSRVYARDPFLTFQSVEVQPAVDASSLEELMILRPGRGVAPPAPLVAPEAQEDVL